MEKRKACTILALLASCAFTAIYFAVFGNLEAKSVTYDHETVKTEETAALTLNETELYWLQLGVFKEEASYRELLALCESLEIEPLVVSSQSKSVLIVGCSEDEAMTEAALAKVQGMELEYLKKSAFITDEQALLLISQKKYQEVLEGFVYQ